MFLDADFQYTLEEELKIKELRRMVKASGNLDIGTENVFLTKFLNYGNWSVDAAFEAIQRYYSFKDENPSWVANHPVSFFREHFFKTLSKFVMTTPDKDGRAIVVFKTVDAFDRFPNYFHDIIEMDDLIFESLLLIPQVQKCGITIIYDLSGTTKKFLRMLSPSIARTINAKNDVLPFTSRMVHIIQKGFLMNAAVSLIMPFVSKDFKDKIFIHDGKNFEKLRSMVGYENLPAQYGGPKDNVPNVSFIYDHMSQNAEYLQQLQTYQRKSRGV